MVFELLSKISCSEDFEEYLLNRKLIYSTIFHLSESSPELRSTCFKILHNVSHRRKIGLNTFVGFPHENSIQDKISLNIVFLHGLLGKSFRTWRVHDSLLDSSHHSYCWPIDWLPNSLLNRNISPKVILMTYPTALSNYTTNCLKEQQTMVERAQLLRQNLKQLDLKGKVSFFAISAHVFWEALFKVLQGAVIRSK